MVCVDDKVKFDPFEKLTGFGADRGRGNYVTGTVVSVNYGHKWFSVEYGNPTQRTSFNFCDIGNEVKIIGCI